MKVIDWILIVLFVAAFLALTFGCGSNEIQNEMEKPICKYSDIPNKNWHPTLEGHFNDFADDALDYGRSIFPSSKVPHMVYKEELVGAEENIVGLCITITWQSAGYICKSHEGEVAWKEIHILESIKERYNELEQRILSYHELGHCFLGKMHTPHPEDIMFPKKPEVTEETYDDAIDRFFKDEEY